MCQLVSGCSRRPAAVSYTHKEGAYYGLSMQGRDNFVLSSTKEAGLCSPDMKTRCGLGMSGDGGGLV